MFHEVRFPTDISFGASGGPERRVDIVTLSNGREERNTPWRHSRRRWDAGVGMRSLDDLARITAFFEARSGQLYGFRWKDWTDFKSCAPSQEISAWDQEIGTGDGETRRFVLGKLYASGESDYWRPVQKPVEDSVICAVNDAQASRGAFRVEDGAVVFAAPPARDARITAGFEFDVPVRFDTDRLDVTVAHVEAGAIPHVPVLELRL
ncbi:TIGR02217 family protein [Paracoccaceae bacterium GXU_MW_L88]